MNFVKKPVKGMNDVLPADMQLREKLINSIKENYAAFGYQLIETPMMEHIENLTSKQGGDNEKLIFKVMKRGRDLQKALDAGDADLADNGMRYDLTVPLARFYANNKEELPQPFKSLQIGSVWRADNPQKGRFRQFVQCDIDVLGDATSTAEIDLIAATSKMLHQILEHVEHTGLTIQVNDRRILKAAAHQAGFADEDLDQLLITLDKLDKIGFEGVSQELTDHGYDPDQVAAYLALYQNADGADLAAFCTNIDSELLDSSIVENLAAIIASAKELTPEDVSIAFSPMLVRGMGYYTGPIFEVTLDGYGFSVAGGGRYDGMIGNFSGEPTPACGFSLGFERLITVLKDNEYAVTSPDEHAYVYLLDKKVSSEKRLKIMKEAESLRRQGNKVSVEPMKKNVGRQISALEQLGYTHFIKVYDD